MATIPFRAFSIFLFNFVSSDLSYVIAYTAIIAQIGDRVKSVYNNNQYDIIGLTDTHYTLEEVENKFKYVEPIIEDKNLELVPKKFDITTLKPLESKVLMRSSNAREWVGTIYSHYNNKKFYGCGMYCEQCIPYEGNEHLLGKTDDCDKYFKTW